MMPKLFLTYSYVPRAVLQGANRWTNTVQSVEGEDNSLCFLRETYTKVSEAQNL